MNKTLLFEEQAGRRYMVVRNADQADHTIRKAIEEIVQLNQRHRSSFDRDRLVQMPDEALAAQP